MSYSSGLSEIIAKYLAYSMGAGGGGIMSTYTNYAKNELIFFLQGEGILCLCPNQAPRL